MFLVIWMKENTTTHISVVVLCCLFGIFFDCLGQILWWFQPFCQFSEHWYIWHLFQAGGPKTLHYIRIKKINIKFIYIKWNSVWQINSKYSCNHFGPESALESWIASRGDKWVPVFIPAYCLLACLCGSSASVCSSFKYQRKKESSSLQF